MSHGGNYHTPPPTYNVEPNYTEAPPTFNPDPNYGEGGTSPDRDPVRIPLFNKTLPAEMPLDIKILVINAMNKWEQFLRPNKKYNSKTDPGGLIKIFWSDEVINNFYAYIKNERQIHPEYPYPPKTATLGIGSLWSTLTSDESKAETILHEMGHALGFACAWSFVNLKGIPQIDQDTGLISPGSHYANLLNLWNQKSPNNNTYLPVNGGFVNNNLNEGPDNKWDAHWFAYLSKTVNGEFYQGVKNDIMCPATKTTPEINIITDLTLEHAKALGYEVIREAEGEPDFTDLRSNEELRFYGNCVI